MNWGDFFIALNDESHIFDPLTDCRFDLEIERAEVSADSEDEFVTVKIDTKPHVGGLYKPGQKLWAFVSYLHENGTTYLLAKAKIDGFPLSADSESHTLVFKCAPSDWEAMQLAVLQPTKAEPHWDDVLVDPESRDDPTEILDGQSRVIAFHPATHACELHDIFGHGLDVIDFGLEWFDDSLSAEISGPALSEVEVSVTATWKQILSGTLLASGAVTDAFDGTPSTLTPDDFENRWPRVGDGVENQNGYSVIGSSLKRTYPAGSPAKAGPFSGSSDNYQYITDAQLTAKEARGVELDIAYYDHDLSLSWTAEQTRRETIILLLTSGVQDSSLGKGGKQKLALDCQDVTVDDLTTAWMPFTYYPVNALVKQGSVNWRRVHAGVSAASWGEDFSYLDTSTFPPTFRQNWERQSGDQSPIGGIEKDRYFPTTRGHKTLMAAAMKGRAMLADSMRNVEVTFEVPLEDAIEKGLWLGKVARISIPEGRLAIEGDHVQGKVTAYRMVVSAGEDDHVCSVTIKCALGSGKDTSAPAGTYTASLTGESWDVVAIPSVAALQPAPMPTGGIIRARVENLLSNQIAYVQANDYNPAAGRSDANATDPSKLLSDVPTILSFDLAPLAADDELSLEASITCPIPFEGPRQIDLGGE